MALTVVIAETWEHYDRYCERHDIDPKDRKKVVPLVTFPDKYRIWGRNLRGCKVVRVGNVSKTLMREFSAELKKSGWGKD